jgi:hypothetical protein
MMNLSGLYSNAFLPGNTAPDPVVNSVFPPSNLDQATEVSRGDPQSLQSYDILMSYGQVVFYNHKVTEQTSAAN